MIGRFRWNFHLFGQPASDRTKGCFLVVEAGI